MNFPETWGTLLLKEAPGELAAFAAHLQLVTGVSASPTDLGWLQLPGGFLACIEPRTYPRDVFEQPAATDAPSQTETLLLHVTGGGYETDNLGFRAQSELTALGREPSKTSRFLKVERFTELMANLMPLAHGCVLPLSGFRFVSAPDWPATFGAGEVFGNFVTLANCGTFIHTRGMRYFALPEVGLAIPSGSGEAGFQAAVRRLFDATFEIAWQGFFPGRTATLEPFVDRSAAPCEVRALSEVCQWVTSEGEGDEVVKEWICRSHVGASLKMQYVFDDAEARRDHVKVAAFAQLDGARVFSTAGLHLRPRHGGPPVELLACPDLFYPAVARVLAFVVQTFLNGPNLVRANDRIAMPGLEARDFAGVILWPCGHVNTHAGKVETWDALPFTPSELTGFRAGGQQAWMDRVADTNAFGALHGRWKQLA